MLVCFEGPNHAGKSTLLRAVAALRPTARVLRHPPKARGIDPAWPHAETTHAEYQALRCVDLRRDDVFVDRLWATDAVYGRVFRRATYDRSYVRPALDFGSVLVVHVTVSDWRTLAARGRLAEDDPAREFLEPLRVGFFDYFRYPPEGAACPYESFYTDLGATTDAQVARIIRLMDVSVLA